VPAAQARWVTRALANLTTVAVTGFAQGSDRQRSRDEGFDRHVSIVITRAPQRRPTRAAFPAGCAGRVRYPSVPELRPPNLPRKRGVFTCGTNLLPGSRLVGVVGKAAPRPVWMKQEST
jgi:hypothetical protein